MQGRPWTKVHKAWALGTTDNMYFRGAKIYKIDFSLLEWLGVRNHGTTFSYPDLFLWE